MDDATIINNLKNKIKEEKKMKNYKSLIPKGLNGNGVAYEDPVVHAKKALDLIDALEDNIVNEQDCDETIENLRREVANLYHSFYQK